MGGGGRSEGSVGERGEWGGEWGGIGAVISCWIRGEGRENYTFEERGAIYSRQYLRKERH